MGLVFVCHILEQTNIRRHYITEIVLNYSNAAGEFIFILGLQEIVIVIAAETLFPGYSSRANDLSDLASTVA
jgi:hypothetical protein